MNETDKLYAALQSDIGAIANVLFDLSETLLGNQGNFLPHAAVLTKSVALYLPFEKALLKDYVFGSTFSLMAKQEVNAWASLC